jgi:hypothetical protein
MVSTDALGRSVSSLYRFDRRDYNGWLILSAVLSSQLHRGIRQETVQHAVFSTRLRQGGTAGSMISTADAG